MSYICSGKSWGKALVAVVAVLVFAGAQSWAGDSIKVKESQADKVKCKKYNDDGESYTECNQRTNGKFSVKAVAFSDVDVSDPEVAELLDPETTVEITVGNWSWSGVLGDDSKYVAGKKKAKFKLTHEKCPEDEDADCKEVKHGSISLAVTKKGLKVTIAAKTGGLGGEDEDGLEQSIIAAQHAEDNDTFEDEIIASINIGDTLIQEVTVGVAGKAKTKTVTKGKGEDAEEFELNSVKLKSTGIVPDPE